MKLKLILLFSLAFLGVTAQETSSTYFTNLDKGHFNMGVSSSSLSLSNSSQNIGNKKSKTTSFNLGFDMGYFVTKNFQLGIYSDLDLSSYEGKSYTNHFSIGPKINYYFTSGNHFAPFVSVSGGYLKEKAFIFSTDGGYAWRLGPGLSYFVNKNIAIQALLQYEVKSYDVTFDYLTPHIDDPAFESDRTKHFSTSLINFSFGFSVFL